jgi:hypothetical protein
MFSSNKGENVMPLLPEHTAGDLDLLPMGTKIYPSAYSWSPQLRGIAFGLGVLSFILFTAACVVQDAVVVVVALVAA